VNFVLDASAVLASLLNEPGGDYVHDVMDVSEISAVNLSEVYAKLIEKGSSQVEAEDILKSGDFRIRSFDEAQAIQAATLRPLTRHLGLSFGDRACLALAQTRDLPILTADREWAKLDIGIEIQLIR
jgi:ribonuclease VapC